MLSGREEECLEGVAALKNSKMIARELGLSSKTVDGHIERAIRKLGARDRFDAARRLRSGEYSPRERVRLETDEVSPDKSGADTVPGPLPSIVPDPSLVTPHTTAGDPFKGYMAYFVMTVILAAAIAILLMALPSLSSGADRIAWWIKHSNR